MLDRAPKATNGNRWQGPATALLRCAVVLGLLSICSSAWSAELAKLLSAIKQVGPQGAGHAEAISAIKELSRQSAEELPKMLAAMNEASPLAANWLRSAIEAVAGRAIKSNQKLPLADLESFTTNTANSSRARRLAYELLTQADASYPEKLLPKMLADPSLELRRDAVQRVIDQATALMKNGQDNDKSQAAAKFREAFTHARDLDQLESLAKELRKLGAKVDLPRHLGFLMEWRVVGPFDNTDKQGFAVTYPPESQLDYTAEYNGKTGTVNWQTVESKDQYGMVDLNATLGKHKGAIAYAAAEFIAEKDTPCQLRLGCINANKIWLNGELLFEREVYHALTNIDQYVAQGNLKPGKNVILLKICQNEQTEAWAQDWAFQLRICDPVGTAILAKDRPETPAAALEAPPEKKDGN
jgi:hypothetical protein